MRGGKILYGRVLTAADRAKLYRMRQSGALSPEAGPEEVRAALALPRRPGPSKTAPGTRVQRQKVRRFLKKKDEE